MTPRCARPTWAKASRDAAHLISRVVLFLSRCLILSRAHDSAIARTGEILPCRIFFLTPIIEATSRKKRRVAKKYNGGRESPVKTRFALPLVLASAAAEASTNGSANLVFTGLSLPQIGRAHV